MHISCACMSVCAWGGGGETQRTESSRKLHVQSALHKIQNRKLSNREFLKNWLRLGDKSQVI